MTQNGANVTSIQKVFPLLSLQCLHSISFGQAVLWQPEALLKTKQKKQKKRECKKKFNQWLTQRLKGNVSAWITKQTKERVGGRENVSMQCLNIIPLSRAASISFVKSASLPASEVFNWTNHFKKKKNLQETQCVLRHNQAHGHNEMFSFTKLNRPYTHRYVYAPFTGQKFSSL